jgi:hypothetical protein
MKTHRAIMWGLFVGLLAAGPASAIVAPLLSASSNTAFTVGATTAIVVSLTVAGFVVRSRRVP